MADGADGGARPKRRGSVVERFNYDVMEIKPEEIFAKYDEDKSGTIDADELEDILYDCGIVLDEENIAEARKGLGLESDDSHCDQETFTKWWEEGHGKCRKAMAEMLQAMGKRHREEIIPELKKLFKEADADGSGSIDPDEFKDFHKKLVDFLGYDIGTPEECIKEMDADEEYEHHDGVIQYEEFEYWYLRKEKARLDKAAAAKE